MEAGNAQNFVFAFNFKNRGGLGGCKTFQELLPFFNDNDNMVS